MRTCPHCSSDVESGLYCPLCGTRIPPTPPPPRSPWPIFKVLGCLGLVAILVAIAVPGFVAASRASGERGLRGSLKMLATAEADFRANDRDGNRINDFWTGDVAGLYCITPGGGPESIKLIELFIAQSDSDPLRLTAPLYRVPIRAYGDAAPRSGYWHWAMRADASVEPPDPYRQDTHGERPAGSYYNTSRFGFLAFPESPSTGCYAFIVNEMNTVFKRRVDGPLRPSRIDPPGRVTLPGFLDWPGDDLLLRDWSKVD